MDEGLRLPLPDIELHYLPDILFEIGPTMFSGMGEAPLSSGDLLNWQHETGITLQPWEARMLRRLSREYLASSQVATKPDCPAPWAPEAEQIDRPAVAKKIKSIFR